jgi:hypothetical protein
MVREGSEDENNAFFLACHDILADMNLPIRVFIL